MTQADHKRPSPFSLRLTFKERAQLEKDAAGMSLATYIKWRVFDPTNPAPKKRNKAPVKDHAELAKLISILGRSRLSQNLNQLAHAANMGTLVMDEETKAELVAACRDIADMREMNIQALGLQE